MSVIQRLELEGYRSVGDKQVIDLSKPGLVLFTGDNRDRGVSSGAGKSTLFKALCAVLFEENDDDSVKSNGINALQREKGFRIGCNFTSDEGVQYYAVQSYQHPTDGSDWYLWEWRGEKWHDKREEKKGDTKGVIQKILRMDYGQFVNRAYMAQETTAEFIWRKQSERIEIFSGILHLGAIDRWVQSARDMKKETDKELTAGKGKAALLDSQIAQKKATLKTDKEIANLKIDLAELDTCMRKIEDELDEKRESAKQIGALLTLKANYAAQQKVLEGLKEKKSALGTVPTPNGVNEDTVKDAKHIWENTDQRHREWDGKLRAARQRIAEIEALGDSCGSCEQPITEDQRQHLTVTYDENLQSVQRHEAAWREEKAIAKAEYERQKEAWETIYRKQCDHHRMDADIRKAQGVLESHAGKIADMRRILGDAVDYPDRLNDEFRALTDRQIACERDRTQKQAIVNAALEAVDQYQGLVRDRSVQEEMNTTLEERIAHLKKIDSLLGDRGFRSYKIKSSRVQFNRSLSRYLSILTDGEVEAELVTEVPKADGKGMKSELDILVKDGDKTGVPIRQYSGGEKAMLSVSITGAFWDLATHQSGGSINVLLLDEPFSNMDPWQVEKACKLLEAMRDSGRIILVVTNQQSVRDRGIFDREIRAVKQNHITRFEEYDLSSDH